MVAGLIALGVIAFFVLLFIFLPIVAWIILGLILLILLLVLFVPVGADLSYIKGKFSLAARVDGFTIHLFPKKPADPNKSPKEKREKKPKKEKKPKEPGSEKEDKTKKKKFDFTLEEIFELIKKVFKGLGKFGKLTVHRFMLHYVAAGNDPYNTAMTYNYVNAGLCSIAPLCAQKFRIAGDVDVWTDIDFSAEKMMIDTELSVTLRLAQLVRAGLAAAFGALAILLKNRQRLRREARALKKQQADDNLEDTIYTQETIQAEERKETNG